MHLNRALKEEYRWQICLSLVTIGVMTMACTAFAQDFNSARPNAEGQMTAFEGQTRARVIEDDVKLKQAVVVSGLENPWGMTELSTGGWLVTERPGRMRLISADAKTGDPIRGIPPVDARGQGGLLDVVVRDDFERTRRVWWSFSEPRGEGRNSTSVGTGTLSADGRNMTDVSVIFRQEPAWASTYHFGSRLVFDRTGALFVTTGERSMPESRALAQDVLTHIGKVIRINPDGGAAEGNPKIPGGLPEIWSYGHRNIQAAAIGPDGALWTVEHGARGGDELNRPEGGKNYGWPIITYGSDYSGRHIGDGLTAQAGMEQPLYFWDPVIAPSGLTFYDGDMFPTWRGSALIGGLAGMALVRLELDGTKVTGEARYLQDEQRIRDVAIASDGAVMVLTDSDDGALIRLTPAK